MAEEKKIKPINRLKTAKAVRPILNRLYQEGIEAITSGKPVVWSMVNWWHATPILKAMDLVTIYPENYGAACAAAGAAPEFLNGADTEGFPTHLCGYARNCIGYTLQMSEKGRIPSNAPLGGMAKPMLLLGSGFFCDARFKWFQSLKRYWKDVPMWVMEAPQPRPRESLIKGVTDYSIEFLVTELREFVSFLERLTQKRMNWDSLEEVVDTTEKVLHIWYEINALRKAVPCPMHSRDFWTLMVPAFYRSGDLSTLEMYKSVLAEVKDRIVHNIGAIGSGRADEEKYRLAFIELPPWHSMGVFDRLAEKGFNFVIESWSYHPPPPLETTVKTADPLERIARMVYWFHTNTNASAVKAGRTAGALVEPFIRNAAAYQLDGALIHPLLSCRANAIYPLHIRDLLEQDAGVPSLVIPGDIVDFSVFNESSVLDQAEAFIETMEYYREIRAA